MLSVRKKYVPQSLRYDLHKGMKGLLMERNDGRYVILIVEGVLNPILT